MLVFSSSNDGHIYNGLNHEYIQIENPFQDHQLNESPMNIKSQHTLNFYNLSNKKIEYGLMVKLKSHVSCLCWLDDFSSEEAYPTQQRILLGLDKITKIKVENQNQVLGQQSSFKYKLIGELGLISLQLYNLKNMIQKTHVHSFSEDSHSRYKVISMHYHKGKKSNSNSIKNQSKLGSQLLPAKNEQK